MYYDTVQSFVTKTIDTEKVENENSNIYKYRYLYIDTVSLI